MKSDIAKYKEKHLAFWELSNVNKPMVGFTVGAGADAWSYWQDNKAAVKLFQKEEILPEDIKPAEFIEDQLRYLESTDEIDDDVIRTALPLASIPWMEAILGCPVVSSKTHLRSKEILDKPDAKAIGEFDKGNPWVKKYFEFVELYYKKFGDKYPVAQSILRGPSDLVCALLGAEKAAMALIESPGAMHGLFDKVTGQLESFLQMNMDLLPQFYDGYVIGQYEIWAPEPVVRIQEDFSILFSPKNYEIFLKQKDKQLAAKSNYTLIHLHSSSLYLVDKFLEIPEIKAFQVTKDPGGVTLDEMLPQLLKIQEAKRPMIVKGQLDKNDLELIIKKLSMRGLCVQPVVADIKRAEDLLPLLR